MRDRQFVGRSRNALYFWATETAPECSHGPASCPCTKPAESSQNVAILRVQDQCYSKLALPSCPAVFLVSYMYRRSWPFRLALFRRTNRLRSDVQLAKQLPTSFCYHLLHKPKCCPQHLFLELRQTVNLMFIGPCITVIVEE